MTPGNNVPKRLAAKAQLALRDEDPCKVAIPFWVREGPTMRGTHETSATKPRARRLGALGSRHRSGPDITRRAISDSSFLAASTDDGAERHAPDSPDNTRTNDRPTAGLDVRRRQRTRTRGCVVAGCCRFCLMRPLTRTPFSPAFLGNAINDRVSRGNKLLATLISLLRLLTGAVRSR